MADAKKEVEAQEQEQEQAGTLLFAGCTDYSILGKVTAKPALELPNLPSPTLFKALSGIKVKRIFGGSAAQHLLLIDGEDRLWSWGNNAKGQLGVGHTTNLAQPSLVKGALEGKKVLGGAAGKGHTVVFLSDGSSFSFGTNKYGQLGLGSVKHSITSKKKNQAEEIYPEPVKNTVMNCR